MRDLTQARADEEAMARLTALGLLVEIGLAGLTALVAWFFGELSRLEWITMVIVIGVGAPTAWVLLFAPRLMIDSRPGQAIIMLAAVAQLLLLTVLAAQIVDYGNPHLGVNVAAVAFRLASCGFVVLVLTGCVRALLAGDRNGFRGYRRTATRLGLVVTGVCLLAGAAVAFAGSQGLRCSTFSFDARSWRSQAGGGDRDRIARTLVKCDTLIGKTRPQVRAMLGQGGGKGKARYYDVSSDNPLELGDARLLVLGYDGTGRVRRASLPSGGD
jgi:hypothetical protein